MSHFGLSREDVLSAATLADERVAEWFLSRSSDRQVEQWNQVALNLGRPRYAMAERFAIALATTCKKVAGRGLTTVFEVLEADEKDA